MLRFDPGDMFGLVASIVLGLGFFALVAYLVYLFVYRRIQMRHEIRLEMIKQGMKPEFEADSLGSLKAGLVSAGVGLALLVALVLDSRAKGDFLGAEVMLGLVPLMVGLGLVLFHGLWGSRRKKEGKPPEN
ncbi:MAG: DUF6249 domain-containing protein [bacterium]